MAKNKNRRRSPVAPQPLSLEVLGDDMRQHVASLGLGSLDAYLAWCRRHGFGVGLHKSGAVRQRELDHEQRSRGRERLRACVRVRNPAEAVRRLLAGEGVANEGYARIAEVLTNPAVEPERVGLLAQVLQCLSESAPDTLRPGRDGLALALRAADHHADVVRPVAAWQPRTRNETRLLASLVQHLFERYPTPPCLLEAWFVDDEAARRHRRWHLHVAAGGNLRTAPGLPIELTKRMAHACLQAPVELSPPEMLRYGQVKGLGGSDGLARAVVASQLGREFAHDDFWRTFVLFCIRFGIEDGPRIGAAIDFLDEHRHGQRVVVDGQGQIAHERPLQPNLSMHGRTPQSLQQQVEHWHRRLGGVGVRDPGLRWLPGSIPGYRVSTTASDGAKSIWSVRELCSSLELRQESARMKHCVLAYAAKCARGTARIFTMTEADGSVATTAATIEVIDKRIVQVRARANRRPSTAALEHLRRWAQGAGLTIAAGACG